MKFYERVISDFGGYEKCKDILSQPNIGFIMNVQALRKHMLEYRRQHNIFEVGDKVVSKENNEFVYTVITVDGGLGILKNILFNHVYPLHDFRHATPEEIAAGRRL